jgi:hypothetical protein
MLQNAIAMGKPVRVRVGEGAAMIARDMGCCKQLYFRVDRSVAFTVAVDASNGRPFIAMELLEGQTHGLDGHGVIGGRFMRRICAGKRGSLRKAANSGITRTHGIQACWWS